MITSPQNPGLTDVPETMLWTLHSRAGEAMRPDSAFPDPKAVEIYRGLDYDFEHHFGRTNPFAAMRARTFDKAVSRFTASNPGGSVVNLGEGLETQRYRMAGADARWYTVDLPEAISIRERFIQPDGRHRHLALSATDREWFTQVPRNKPVLIAAQGLFMYFEAGEVKSLLRDVAAHFLHCQIVFDAIPYWVSRASVIGRGLPLTRHYRTPPMPWGVHPLLLRATLRRWLGQSATITYLDYPLYPRGPLRALSHAHAYLPGARYAGPIVVELALGCSGAQPKF